MYPLRLPAIRPMHTEASPISPCRSIAVAAGLLLASHNATQAADRFQVTLDSTPHGTITLAPPIPSDGFYDAGTVVTVTAIPDPGYTIDSCYYSVPGRWGAMYHEGMTPGFRVTIDQAKHIGASFIETSEVDHIDVIHDVVYAQPGVKPLKYDVFKPKEAQLLPIIVIIHGGGWVTNDEDVMRGLARELTRGGKFVACSVDYRWGGRADGDKHPNTMANLIEDVYGAVVHIMEHAGEYGGDPTRIGLTGDSAGGHLSASCSLMVDRIGEQGFGKTPGIFQFKPSYMPKDKTVDEIRIELLSAIRGAAPSYGVFGGPFLNHYSDDPAADDTWREAISPIMNIPNVQDRAVPQFLTRGTRDPLISDQMVSDFMNKLVEAVHVPHI